MKRKLSFLFFNMYLMVMASVHDLQAQSAVDSVKYYYELALHPKNETSLVSAYQFFIKHKEECLAKNYIEGAVDALSYLSIIQKESGYYHESEALAVEAISLLETLEETDYSKAAKITLYNELGKISRALMEYERALMYYDIAFNMAKRPEDLNIIRYNKAFIHMDQKKFEQALPEFEQAYKISLKIKNEKEIAHNLDNVGYVKSKLNHGDALNTLEEALKMKLELDDLEGIYASYKHLSEYYKDRNEEQRAVDYLNKSLEIARLLNSESYQLDALSSLVDFKKDSTVMSFKILSDKTRLDNLLAENKYTSKKYDYTKKELEAQKSQLKTERTQLLVLLVGLLSIFTIWFLRIRYKKANIQKVFDTETRISKKIHDELANDMSDIMNFVQNELQTSEENKTQLLNVLEDVYIRTRDISTETASIDFDNFSESLKHLLIQHNKEEVKVIINDINTIDWDHLHQHKKLAIYRCLQELMVNMKKHSNAHLVTIIFKKHKNKNEIRYTDDGKGCTIEKINANGLKNAESRIKEVGGSFTFETSEGNGFKAIIIF